MKVVHNNSREEFDLSEPVHFKYAGTYGHLIMSISEQIYFFSPQFEWNNLTLEFTKL